MFLLVILLKINVFLSAIIEDLLLLLKIYKSRLIVSYNSDCQVCSFINVPQDIL